ncbi:MAG TPA: GldG family protein [Acidimicrobiales bacterium]|nr:GldG family protein [Acidimicrobiales bacterium]
MRPRLLVLATVLAGVVVLGFLTDRVHGEIDLTAGHSLSLSKETKDVLGHVHHQVRITAFLLRSDPSRAQAASLLARYRGRNHWIAYRVLDPTETPGEAARLDIDPTEGGVALSMGGLVERAPTVTESDLTSGIARLLRHHPAALCITTGHGEPSIDESGRAGLGTLAGLLASNGYRVQSVDLLVHPSVPSSCDGLVIVNPTSPLGPAQQAVADYLAAGGRTVVLNDPASTVDLTPLLQPYGMAVVHGIVLEGDDGSRLPGDPLSPVVHDFTSSSPVVRHLPPVVLPTAEAVLTASEPGRGLSVAPLAATSRLSFLSRRPSATGTRFDPAVDLRGPINLGGAADLVANEGGRVRRTRVVALGDSDFATNGLIGEGGNARLLVQSVDWVTLEEGLVSVSTNIPELRPLALTEARLRYLRFVAAGVVPSLFLLAGGMVWAFRRGR